MPKFTQGTISSILNPLNIILLLALTTQTNASNPIFNNFSPQCQSCIDTIHRECSSTTSTYPLNDCLCAGLSETNALVCSKTCAVENVDCSNLWIYTWKSYCHKLFPDLIPNPGELGGDEAQNCGVAMVTTTSSSATSTRTGTSSATGTVRTSTASTALPTAASSATASLHRKGLSAGLNTAVFLWMFLGLFRRL